VTTKDLAHFQTILEARETELKELLRDREVVAVNLSADMLDQIQNAQERDMAMGNLERGSARLLEVRSALRRIQLGTFGICADCEEDISMKRLAAVPWTTSCLSCREAADRSESLTPNEIEEPFPNAA
jgi:DnaK suppressor protein